MKNTTDRLSEPILYYRVAVYVTTFEGDEGKNEPFEHVEEFKGNDFSKIALEAWECYLKTNNNLASKGGYFLPFASEKDFVQGKNSAYSCMISLVVHWSDDEETGEDEYPLEGEGVNECFYGKALENFISNFGHFPSNRGEIELVAEIEKAMKGEPSRIKLIKPK